MGHKENYRDNNEDRLDTIGDIAIAVWWLFIIAFPVLSVVALVKYIVWGCQC